MIEHEHEILEKYRMVLVQIATPYSTGTGFYLSEYQLIVTNEHVIRGNRSVVINSDHFEKQLAAVKFVDARLDLAFIDATKINLGLVFLQTQLPREGDAVIACGHPFGQAFYSSTGLITRVSEIQEGTAIVQHDATLDSSNNGGPLINQAAEIIGINTFQAREGKRMGQALPSTELLQAIEAYQSCKGRTAARCQACAHLVVAGAFDGKYCPHCGSKIVLPSEVAEYEPVGVCQTIEDILRRLGQPVDLARMGPNLWEVIEGSAKVYLTYHEESGLIIGDSFLARLPKKDIGKLYEFLLRENYQQENLSFSVKGSDIILSLIIYDRYLNIETGELLMKRLFEMSDHYDDMLVEQYGAIWRENLNES